MTVPVIAIDGGAGTGKSTVASGVAKALGFHFLNSGIFYRAVGMVALDQKVDMTNVEALEKIARELKVTIDGDKVFVNGVDESKRISSNEMGKMASLVGQVQKVRDGVRSYQLDMQIPPGLVADGRDMSVIFDTPYVYFLQATPEVKAERRMKQLASKGTVISHAEALEEIHKRDHADKNRDIAPLIPHPNALIIDTSHITAAKVIEKIVESYREKSRS